MELSFIAEFTTSLLKVVFRFVGIVESNLLVMVRVAISWKMMTVPLRKVCYVRFYVWFAQENKEASILQ